MIGIGPRHRALTNVAPIQTVTVEPPNLRAAFFFCAPEGAGVFDAPLLRAGRGIVPRHWADRRGARRGQARRLPRGRRQRAPRRAYRTTSPHPPPHPLPQPGRAPCPPDPAPLLYRLRPAADPQGAPSAPKPRQPPEKGHFSRARGMYHPIARGMRFIQY